MAFSARRKNRPAGGFLLNRVSEFLLAALYKAHLVINFHHQNRANARRLI